MTEGWTIELFGGLRARRAGDTLARFRTHKTAALLAYLAFYRERAHPRDVLAELLWPEADGVNARHSLAMSLTALRHALEPPGVPQGAVILAGRTTVQLSPLAVTTDVAAFENAIGAEQAATDVKAKIALLTEAVDLYSGDLLPGFYESWVVPQMLRLEEMYFLAVRGLVTLLAEAGDAERAIAVTGRAAALAPLREEPQLDLMRLYARTGRPQLAVRQYEEYARLLERETGESPPDVAHRLAQKLGAKGEGRAWALAAVRNREVRSPVTPACPPFQRAGRYAPPLPPVLTRFFGREPELDRLRALLGVCGTCSGASARLVTLTGPGGCGKTRLALHLAEELRRDSALSVWFVPLAGITDADRLCRTVADSVTEGQNDGEPLDRAVKVLSRQPAILILDNFEQLLQAEGMSPSVRVVRELLGRVPSLCVLVTSRQPLELGGEQEIPVAPLAVPLEPAGPERLMEFPCVSLFADRAQLARPDFQVTQSNARAVAELCRRLEGIPLAIELAAAHASVLSPAGMLARLADRFDFLVSRKRDRDSRHESLRAALDWSYDLLRPEEQRLFALLSIFRGGWTSGAAAAVADISETCALDGLWRLRDRSLITAEEEGRFGMLETLREYACEKLEQSGETESTRDRHLAYFTQLAEEAGPELTGPEQERWMALLHTEHGNVRSALEWSLTSSYRAEQGLRLAARFYWFWYIRCHYREGREWLDRLLARAGAEAPSHTRSVALNGAGVLATGQGCLEEARAYLEQCLMIRTAEGDRAAVGALLGNLGLICLSQGEMEAARAHFEEAIQVARDLGDLLHEANSLNNLGLVAYSLEDLSRARALYTASIEAYRRTGNRQRTAGPMSNLGLVALKQGDLDGAEALFGVALALNRERGNRSYEATNLDNLGAAARARGDLARARRLWEESLCIRRELPDIQGIAQSLEAAAILERLEGRFVEAARFCGAADAVRESIRAVRPPIDQREIDAAMQDVRSALGDADFTAKLAEGRALTWEQAVEKALQTLALCP
jgi:predicted ATPase/DNA-binding SARP family transcriptional activator/Tfp pilus assembly protein PilF